jgi:hypothetical protein
MDHYYSLSEKRDFIDADFKKSKLYNMGLLPTEDAEVGEYFHEAIKNCTEFVNKYQGKGWSYDYAMQIINDWMDNLERIAKEIKHEADRRATQDT